MMRSGEDRIGPQVDSREVEAGAVPDHGGLIPHLSDGQI